MPACVPKYQTLSLYWAKQISLLRTIRINEISRIDFIINFFSKVKKNQISYSLPTFNIFIAIHSMGIVQRQSIKSSIATYIGVAIGYLNFVILYPRFLSTDQVGLIRVLVSVTV